MFEPLDPVLHSQLRLAIMSLLVGMESAEFTCLLEKTGATKGNLSIQLSRLKEEGYIDIKKSFRNNYPLTSCSITKKGARAFENYVKALSGYLSGEKGSSPD
ncbi:MAG: transcriptional regulator [Bacteroidales bacterium]|nr:transcriptional regulator [Bacteroidales bacterium]